MAFNSLVASLALVGSSLSFLATSSALILIGLHHTRRRSLRHTLVLNLMVAVINSANNTISGIIYVRDQELQRGIATPDDNGNTRATRKKLHTNQAYVGYAYEVLARQPGKTRIGWQMRQCC
ncbi:hypothetical protein CGMCC3_g17972 [Colletotrichum fructicola]|uniref:Uncharacterized protein n=1 Tax=Colletotrichum fructicola (strain Nara gc5) TaxID=1213859 RepID=A0A7J6IDP6_COLFN|nr:uncharacterized protein CGMCC3_g17972 [Colletotrichum fructicola]KAE9565845.1 hypothetical protein CGMCC3_g17972 [Colletotrichum fructicola]KAF4474119.1 hypothetical protein CGGC5_v016810 [Colletotrichum fructicola Nara gc5]KAF4474469.1 hypothetical protein CGGC5_v017228 [Colletotrichum fructicola Nara gc5]